MKNGMMWLICSVLYCIYFDINIKIWFSVKFSFCRPIWWEVWSLCKIKQNRKECITVKCCNFQVKFISLFHDCLQIIISNQLHEVSNFFEFACTFVENGFSTVTNGFRLKFDIVLLKWNKSKLRMVTFWQRHLHSFHHLAIPLFFSMHFLLCCSIHP